jgi:hypothetical protein
VRLLFKAAIDAHFLRDLTHGGISAVTPELARAIALDKRRNLRMRRTSSGLHQIAI